MPVSVAIQHHPRRAAFLPALLGAVGPADVVVDPEPDGKPNPWRTYRLALELTPGEATHRAILQDDVRVCRRFPEALEAAVASRPKNVLALFHGGQPRENLPALQRAASAGEAWAPLDPRRWVPVVALVWPAYLVGPVLRWTDAQKYPIAFRADDEIAGQALRALGEVVLACVPSIVEHEDVEPSLVGQRARGGKDPGRVAARWIGDGDPLAEIAWAA